MIFLTKLADNWIYIKYFKVALAGAFKFIAGIILGLTGPVEKRLSIFETITFSTIGMMITIVIITFLGEKIISSRQEKLKDKPKTIKISWKKRLVSRIKSRWGLLGIAFFTPVLFSPPGGALLAVSIGAPRLKIFISMFISAIFWGLVLSPIADKLVVYFEMIFND